MGTAAAGSPDKVFELHGIVGPTDRHKYDNPENGESDRALYLLFIVPLEPLSRDLLFLTILEKWWNCSGTS